MKKVFVFVVALLAGCSWLPNHHLDYRKAKPIAAMKTPDDLTFSGEQALFPVQDGVVAPEYESRKKDTIPKPPQLAILGAEPEEEEEAVKPQDPTNTRVVMARDGNGYPIIMLHTSYSWAWEYVGQALTATDLKIDDRDRESGIYYVRTPKKYEVEGREAQIKLSHTVNGIQIAVLNRKGSALLEKAQGQQLIQRLYDEL